LTKIFDIEATSHPFKEAWVIYGSVNLSILS